MPTQILSMVITRCDHFCDFPFNRVEKWHESKTQGWSARGGGVPMHLNFGFLGQTHAAATCSRDRVSIFHLPPGIWVAKFPQRMVQHVLKHAAIRHRRVMCINYCEAKFCLPCWKTASFSTSSAPIVYQTPQSRFSMIPISPHA